MKKYLIIPATVLFLFSCNKKTTENTDLQSSKADSSVVIEDEPLASSTVQDCYVAVNGKDSVFISVEDNLGTIIGKMRYKNFEKNSSYGDISGTQHGDTLKLNYTFQAEGTTSEREIYFLKKGGNLVEAIGEHTTEGNIDTYTDPARLTYNGQTLKPINCDDFEKNFIGK